jgi:hypothetical protein
LLSSTESYGLGELSKRLDAAPKDVFSSTTSKFPTRWKSLASGATKIIRLEAEHLYIETILPQEQRRLGNFILADLAKRGETYEGVQNQGLRCNNTFCRVGDQIQIQMLTPNRIEGTVSRPGEELDCKSCKWKGEPQVTKFVWIPE